MIFLLGVGLLAVIIWVIFEHRRIKAEQYRAFNRTINNSFPVGIKPTYYSKD